MKKNNEYNVVIEDMTFEGLGLVHIDGFPVYVDNALTGESVTIRITKVLNKFAYARVMTFQTQSKERREIVDKVGTWVASMPLQHMSYEMQLQLKQRAVMAALEKHIDISEVQIEHTLGMTHPWQYRNKAQVPVVSIDGQLETGLYKRGTHDLIPIENYHIQNPEIDRAILIVRDILREYAVEAYDEIKHEGTMRHIIVRHGHFTNEMMVVLVTNTKEVIRDQEIVDSIKKQLPNVVSIVQNINDQKTNAILGRESKVLFGQDHYTDKVLGKTFKISSQSFFQVNSLQTEVLYQKALEYAGLTGTESVIDAYCGLGTITLNLAEKAKHVYGVEIVEDAIVMAKENAKMNNIDNVVFEANKAEDQMAKWVEEGIEVDVIVVDPPRKGLDASFIEASIKTQTKKIVYVSCNPVTLGRDLKVYVDAGYMVERVQPVDMFPQTTHVETVVLMSRVDK